MKDQSFLEMQVRRGVFIKAFFTLIFPISFPRTLMRLETKLRLLLNPVSESFRLLIFLSYMLNLSFMIFYWSLLRSSLYRSTCLLGKLTSLRPLYTQLSKGTSKSSFLSLLLPLEDSFPEIHYGLIRSS